MMGIIRSFIGLSAVLAVCSLSYSQEAKRDLEPAAQVLVRLPPNFAALPSRVSGLTEIVAQLPQNQTAYIKITTEKRRNDEEAIQRLLEIAQEAGGKRTFLEICGWPALERQYRVKLGEVEPPTDRRLPEAPVVDAATIAIAETNTLIRFQAELSPGAAVEGIASIFGFVRTISCPPNPDPDAARRAIESLKRGLSRKSTEMTPAQSPTFGREPLVARSLESRQITSATAQTSTGPTKSEIQIATSADGRMVVVGSNGGTSFSTNYGGSFAASTAVPGIAGDPTVATGVSGQFYLGGMLFTPSSCSVAVHADTSKTGAAFSFAGNAAFCPMTGNICLPDQPQMAADMRNGTPTGDQLYVVWRNFPGSGSTCVEDVGGTPTLVSCSATSKCSEILSGAPPPTISCSPNNGATWSFPAVVGSGDQGRVTVGSDGFVYVTYVSGANLMLNKFSSCARGLASQPGFPVTIASYNELDCPIEGLDRCTSRSMASPQPAVSKDFPRSVYLAYAEKSGSNNDDIVVRHSRDGGLTWPDRAVANSRVTAHRFLPWICAQGNAATVSWYDRRAATSVDATLTNYFANTVSGSTVGAERNVSIVADSQKTATATFSPKYGDYNGNACTRDRAFVGWASATVPPGVPPPSTTGINVFVEAIPPGPPVINSVTPGVVACGNGMTLDILGANFRGVWLVEAKSLTLTVPLSTFSVISPSAMTVTLPGSLPAGGYEIFISTPSGGSIASTPSGNRFTVFPTIGGVTPNSGPASGGTQVTIDGSCFNQATSFSFGGVQGTNVLCPTSTQCTVVSPPAGTGSAGTVDVVANTAGAISTIGWDSRFTYIGPQITSISPSNGPITGGTQIFIEGSGFPSWYSTQNTQINFGSAQTVAQCDISWCTAVTPAAPSAGPVDVIANAFGTTSAPSANDIFTYKSQPTLVRMDAFGNQTSGGIVWTGVAALDGFAPSGGTSIALTNSDPNIVSVQPSVTVPAGKVAATFPLTVNPSPTSKSVTLTGSYSGTLVSTTINVLASPPLTLSIDVTALDVGQSAEVTIGINSPAPAPNGAAVTLSSSSPTAITVSTPVTIPANTYWTKFPITNHYSSGPQVVTISAMYNGSSAADSVSVFSIPPRCSPVTCPRLQYWNSDHCRCERGLLPAR